MSSTIQLLQLIPVLALIILILSLGLIYWFVKNEKTMKFGKKIRLLKISVNVMLILLIVGYLIAIMFYLLTVVRYNPKMLLILSGIMIPQIIFLIIYGLIYRQYRILIKNFEVENIFDMANAVAFKKIASLTLWLFCIKLIFKVLSVLLIAVVINVSHHSLDGIMLAQMLGTMNVNLTYNFDFSLIYFFIIVLLINILAYVFEKAVEIYHENQLTI